MSNYTPISFNYDAMRIKNSLENNNATGPRVCNSTELRAINDILKLKYPIIEMLFFGMRPNITGPIHLDVLPNTTSPLIFALNLPLQNCNQIRMYWFDKKDKASPDKFYDGDVYDTKLVKLDREDAECVDHVDYTQPHIVKVNKFHCVENQDQLNPGYFISLRFNTKISEQDIIDLFS
jgi:hypothetical protein